MKRSAAVGKALMAAAMLLIPWLRDPAGGAVTIVAKYVSTIANGLNPSDAAWNAATQYTVPLDTIISAAGVPQLLPSSKWRYLRIKAIQNGNAGNIFFRFQWADKTADTSVADPPLFADAVALEVPFKSGYSSIAMGNSNVDRTGNPLGAVNIVFWRADLPNPQNVVSGGIGTVQTSPDSGGPPPDTPPLIGHYSNWLAGNWTVILGRPLNGAVSTRGNMVTFTRGTYHQITFAQWDGGNQERNGVKLVAGSWQTLRIE